MDNNWSIQERSCCYNFDICSPSCIVSHSTLRDVLGHIGMARIALMAWILQYRHHFISNSHVGFFCSCDFFGKSPEQAVSIPKDMVDCPWLADCTRHPGREAYFTYNPSWCAAWFRQLESVGVNLSVDVVGGVVTMSSSSEDEESDPGWSVNSDSGPDMVGGGGNCVAEDCEDGFAGDFGEGILYFFRLHV